MYVFKSKKKMTETIYVIMCLFALGVIAVSLNLSKNEKD